MTTSENWPPPRGDSSASELAKSPTPAVTRAVAILDLLADEGQPLNPSEIARKLDLAKSSTLNICVTLEQAGLVSRREGEFVLGRKTIELGAAYLRRFDIVREFYRECGATRYVRDELAQLAVLDGTQALFLARHEGRAQLRLSATVGDRFPASITAVGCILLAQLSDEVVRDRFRELDSLPRWTDRSVATLPDLLEKLAAVRERGYSIDDREMSPAVYGVAVLIPAHSSATPSYALGASFLHAQMTEKLRDAVVEELVQIREKLTNPMLITD
jgi:DNA-binding IclR family transcriptional regulator